MTIGETITGLRTWFWAVLIVTGILLVASPADAGGDDKVQIDCTAEGRGPGIQMPKAGKTITREVVPGQSILLCFDPSPATLKRVGDDILLIFDSGLLVLQNFATAAESENPPNLVMSDGTMFAGDVILAQMPLGEQEYTTAAGGAGGGGEIFGLINVVSWLLDRLDVISTSQAAGAPGNIVAVETPLYQQIMAQLVITRDNRVLEISKSHRQNTAKLFAEIKKRLTSGSSSEVDRNIAEISDLDAQIELENALFRSQQAIDAYQEIYNTSLVQPAYREWQHPAPQDLAKIAVKHAGNKQVIAAAQQYLKRLRHLQTVQGLLLKLLPIAESARKDVHEHFDVGQFTLNDVIGIMNISVEAQIRQVKNEYDRKQAEAWLLSAAGQLTADDLQKTKP